MSAGLNIASTAVDEWLSGCKRPLVVGICGAQGSGKSTLARHIAQRLSDRGGRVAVLSIDDLYLSRAMRAQMAETTHPLFATRGVPGTHDIERGMRLFDDLRAGRPVALPRFDKGNDNPLPQSEWPIAPAAADIVLFEGWCVGAVAQDDDELIAPVNDLEAIRDVDGAWRRTVNAALKGPYAGLFGRIDRLIMLAAPDFATVRTWRTQQEHGLRWRLKREGRQGKRVMSDAEIADFVQYYERLTRAILAEMPARADLTIHLDASRKMTGHHGPRTLHPDPA